MRSQTRQRVDALSFCCTGLFAANYMQFEIRVNNAESGTIRVLSNTTSLINIVINLLICVCVVVVAIWFPNSIRFHALRSPPGRVFVALIGLAVGAMGIYSLFKLAGA